MTSVDPLSIERGGACGTNAGAACGSAQPLALEPGAERAAWLAALLAWARRVDRVWLALAALFAVLAVAAPGQARESLGFTAESFLWILPFLLLSVALAAWLKAAGVDNLIGRLGAGAPAAAILLAAIFGGLSPFCSCGVVPLVAALLVAGVPLPAVMAFWVSSPLMDPETFVLMAATLGLGFTLAKTVAAVGMGLLAGFATLALMRAGGFRDPLKPGFSGGCGAGLDQVPLRWAAWREAARRRIFLEESWRVGVFLAKWLLLAFAIESLMVAWLAAGADRREPGRRRLAGHSALRRGRRSGLPERLRRHPARGRADEHGHGPGRRARLPDRGCGHQPPGRHGRLRPVRHRVFLWYLATALAGSLLSGYLYQAARLL